MNHEKSGLIYDVLCPRTASTIEGISSFNDFLLKFLPWKQNSLFSYNTVKCQGNVFILVSSLQLQSVTSGASLASLHKNFFFLLGSPEAGMIEVTSVSQKFASEVMW